MLTPWVNSKWSQCSGFFCNLAKNLNHHASNFPFKFNGNYRAWVKIDVQIFCKITKTHCNQVVLGSKRQVSVCNSEGANDQILGITSIITQDIIDVLHTMSYTHQPCWWANGLLIWPIESCHPTWLPSPQRTDACKPLHSLPLRSNNTTPLVVLKHIPASFACSAFLQTPLSVARGEVAAPRGPWTSPAPSQFSSATSSSAPMFVPTSPKTYQASSPSGQSVSLTASLPHLPDSRRVDEKYRGE